jgi:translocation and assembly module TamB
MMKSPLAKQILNYTIIGLFFVLLGFFRSYHLPDFKLWVIDQIDKISTHNGPARVLVSNMDFHAFPIGVSFNQIRVTPKDPYKDILSETFIKEVRVSLNPFSFFTGLFQFSKIEIFEPQVHIKSIKAIEKLSTPNSNEKINLRSILKIPLNTFTIYRMDLSVDPEGDIPQINLNDFSVEMENQKSSALISFISPQLLIFDPNISEIPVEISLGSRFLIQENQILMSALKIKKGDSYILAAGYTETPISNIKFDEVNLKIKTSLKLDELRKQLLPLLKGRDIPEMSGTLDAQTFIVKKPQAPLSTQSKFHFKNLQIKEFEIGNVIGQAIYQNEQIQSSKIQIKNPAGKINLTDLSFKISEPMEYSATVGSEDLQLHDLLKSLGLGDVPVQLDANAQIPCHGKYNQTPFLKCTGELKITNLRVYNPKMDIVSIKEGTLKGSLEVTKDQVNTSADITIGKDTKGFAKGYINYDKGFFFEYDSPNLNFKDFDLANLGLEGVISGKGTTQGDSDAATFGMELKAQDFWIKNYFTGDMAADISYKKGHLKLKDIDGLLRTTKYLGVLDVNLRDDKIVGELATPYIELSDLQKTFSKVAPLPIEIYGGGTATINFSGPLDFSHLSYIVKSNFLNGNIAGESFDDLVFNVTSNKGFVTADKVVLKKSSGTLTLTGTAEPSGQIKTEWVGKNFTLQSLNSFSKTELNMNGDLNFNLSLTDYILSPKSLLTGTLTKTTVSEEPIADSKFSMTFGKNTIEGSGQLMGDKIDAKFVLPLSPNAPFSLKAKTEKWDFVPLIHLISTKSRAQEFSTSLSADIDISSDKNGFWNSTGLFNIRDIRIQRGIKEMRSDGPIALKFQNGNLDVKKFTLKGDNTSIEASSVKVPGYPLSLALNGKIDLGLISFLTPFFDDLRGSLAVTTQLSFGQDKWKLLGSAFITNASIRVSALPHTFDDINADILFSDDKIIVNRFNSDFANGRLTGNGNVEIKGMKNVKTDLYGRFDNVNMRVPEGVVTKGSGDFHITGNWFPYLFEGNYVVQSGLYTKNLEEGGDQKSTFSRSQLLPETLLRKTSEVAIFDMDVIFNKGVDVRNDFIESKAYGRLKIKGPPAHPVLLGQLQLQRGGKFFFRDTVFEFETAELKFNDPNRTNPDMYISANAVVEENVENRVQRYEINMLVQGKPDKYSLTFTSNPPRSEKDIASLLALGVTTETYQAQVGENQLQRQSYEVGASILTKNKFGRDLQNRTGLQFKVSSAIDQRNNTPSPKITISKQWTPKVETSTSRTFGESTTQDVKVAYQLNRNVSLIGSWEGRELSNTSTTTTTTTTTSEKNTTDILGIDIEYKVEFK